MDLLMETSTSPSTTLRQLAKIRGKFESVTSYIGHFLTLPLNQVARKMAGRENIWFERPDDSAMWDEPIPLNDEFWSMIISWLEFISKNCMHIGAGNSRENLCTLVSDAGELASYFVAQNDKRYPRVVIPPTELVISAHDDHLNSDNDDKKFGPSSLLREMSALCFGLKNELGR